MEKSTQTEMSIVELSKEINLKLDKIHSVLGFILEKTKPELPIVNVPEYCSLHHFPEIIDKELLDDDDLDARDLSGSIIPEKFIPEINLIVPEINLEID